MNYRPRSPSSALSSRRLVVAAAAAVAALASGCGGGSSNSQLDQGGSGSGGGSSGAADTTGGGSSGGSSSSGAMMGSSSSGGGAAAGACPQTASLAEAAHVTMTVTWPGSVSTNQGTGTVDIWLLANLTVTGSGTNLTLGGTAQTCGTTLPPIALNGAGQLVSGGSKVQITFPATVWTAPSMPKFDIQGTASGWDSGSSLAFKPVSAPIGVAVPDATSAWPTSAWSFPAGTQIIDADGDGEPGFTAVPLKGNGVVLPPTGLGIFGSAPSADKLYIVAKNNLSLTGTRTSCSDASGTANVTEFDNHVLGCHIMNGMDCTTGMANTQADFVDQSRTVYVPGAATFKAKQLPPTATCADVLSALP